MGQLHAATLRANRCVNLAAVCVRDRAKTENLNLDCEVYDDYSQMLQNSDLDLVIVATPHRLHKEFCIAAIQSGKHVICEKPIATTLADATEMFDAAKSHGVHLTVMSQTRFEPSYRRVKQLLDFGELGEIYRCSITETFWRPDSYYRSADWRGTWAGEGGGVLVNQAPHVIDRYVWLCGAPDEVTSVCDTTLHKIEVEDTASLIFRHKNGTQGFIHVNTNEAPHSRLEIVCERGRITVEDGKVTVCRFKCSIQQQVSIEGSDRLEVTREEMGGSLLNWSTELLHLYYEDFADAIWKWRSPTIAAEHSLTVMSIINAGYLSSWQKRACSINVDRVEYSTFERAMLRPFLQ